MPIFQINFRLFYFAHVPKCAGSSVEDYLVKRFGPLGLLDRRYLDRPARSRWSKTSPQHMDVETLNRLLPPEMIAAKFAVVRHPVDRLISVFSFQRDIARSFPAKTKFADWLDRLPEVCKKQPFQLDNHVRPMADLVPDDADFFQLENGLWPIIRWLDRQAGNEDGPRRMERMNTYTQRLAWHKARSGPEFAVGRREVQQIADLYAADFERFGYDPENCATLRDRSA